MGNVEPMPDAHVLSLTLAHGNSKNEIRQRNRGRQEAEKMTYGKNKSA